MKKINVFIIGILALSLLGAGLLLFCQELNAPAGDYESLPLSSPPHHCAAPADKNFYDAVYSFNSVERQLGSAVLAGIVPHHLLAGDLIAGFYRNLEAQKPETIILMVPNHFRAGSAEIISSSYPWQTPFGDLECDFEFLAALTAQLDNLKLEPSALDPEHAIASQAGFIKKTFPLAKFVPLMLSPNLQADSAEKLALALSAAGLHKEIFIIASIDFSHYLDSPSAMAHDQESIRAIQAADFAKVYALDIDSPPALYALLKYADAAGAGFELLANSNSALLAGKPEIKSVTSYVIGYFLQAK